MKDLKKEQLRLRKILKYFSIETKNSATLGFSERSLIFSFSFRYKLKLGALIPYLMGEKNKHPWIPIT